MQEIDCLAHFRIIFLSLLVVCGPGYATQWQKLAAGIEYSSLKYNSFNPWAKIHVFKVNLAYNRLGVAMANQFAQKTSSVNQLAHKTNALIAINGGFFSTNYTPLGLRISEGKQLSKIKRISWWGIFYTRNRHAYLVSQKTFKPNRQIDFAIQGGPRLLIDGRIPKLKPGVAERTAIGINDNYEVIILVTDHVPISTTELAKLFKNLNCRYALNLDGGNSSQLYASIDNFKLNVSGFSSVTDAVVVKPTH